MTNFSWRKKISVVHYIAGTKFSTAILILCDIHPTRWHVKCHLIVIYQITDAIYIRTILTIILIQLTWIYSDTLGRLQKPICQRVKKTQTSNSFMTNSFSLNTVLCGTTYNTDGSGNVPAAQHVEKTDQDYLTQVNSATKQTVIYINISVADRAVSCIGFPS